MVEDSSCQSSAKTARINAAELRRPDMKVRVRRGDRLVLRTEGLRLTAEDSAVARLGQYSVTALHAEELPPMPEGMVNVTLVGNGLQRSEALPTAMQRSEAGGFRLLPSGRNFSPYAELRVAYDEARLPFGYTPDDIYTSYYDEATRQWVRLQRVAVDTASHEIVSLTDHFTDFVNEVLKAPEMPETQAFVPTMMSELKAADPSEGITRLQPPAANNEGTATLSYPLEIPAGRRGMQPSLSLTYSSAGGPGWLGVGWDIPIPAISVDTRWGVPRYDSQKESETYLYRGEQLVAVGQGGDFLPLPHRTNQWTDRLPDGTRFFPRVDEAADSIVRHGTGPCDYWWEVWDRSGTVHRFGHYETLPDAANPNTLADDRGNRARWCLTESEDAWGNLVRYTYDTVQDAGLPGGVVKGRQIYIAEIRYTMHRDASGAVDDTGHRRIEFHREDNDVARPGRSFAFQQQAFPDQVAGGRIPATISCRSGFKEVTASLLSHVYLMWDDSLYRSWLFGMRCDESTGHRMALTTVMDLISGEQWDINHDYGLGPKGIIYRGRSNAVGRGANFTYYAAPDDIYGEANDMGQVWRDQAGTLFPYGTDVKETGFLSGPQTVLGRELTTTALGMGKGSSWHVGGGVSAGLGFNVFWTELAVGGTFGLGASVDRGALTLTDIDGDGLPDKVFRNTFGNVYYRRHERLDDGTFFFGPAKKIDGMKDFQHGWGANIEGGLQVSLGVSATGTVNKSWSHTTDYMADVNGDGLPDLVTDGGVLFNTTANGAVSFTPFSELTGGEGYKVATPSMPCGDIIYDGKVNDSLYCPRVRREKIREYRPWHDLDSAIRADFLDSGYVVYYNQSLVVKGYRMVRDCGDRAHRVGNVTSPAEEAVLVWRAPMGGTVTVTDSVRMLPDPTGAAQRSRYADGVRRSVTHYSVVASVGDSMLQCASSAPVAALCGATGRHDTLFTVRTAQLDVSRGDLLMFRLQSGDSRMGDRVDWRHAISYTSGAPAGNDAYGRPRGEYSSVSDYVVSGSDHFQAPCEGTLRLDIGVECGVLNSGFDIRVRFHDGAVKTYSVSSQAETTFHATRPGSTIIDMPFHRGDSITVDLVPSGAGTTWGEVKCLPRYVFTPAAGEDVLGPVEAWIAPRIPSLADSADAAHAALFGPMYRGWGRFAYNASGTDPDAPMPLTSLRCPLTRNLGGADTNVMKGVGQHFSEGGTFGELSAAVSATGNYNPLDTTRSRWLRMSPDCRRQAFLGYGAKTVLTDTMAANVCPQEWYAEGEAAEAMAIDCPAPQPTPDYPEVKTHARLSEGTTYNLSLSANVGVTLGASWSSGGMTTTADYMDLNGDRFPDLISEGGVQYTMPWGGVGSRVSDIVTEMPRSGTWSLGASVAPGDKGQEPRPMFGRLTGRSMAGSAPDRASAVSHPDPSLNPSGGMVGGNDTTSVTLADINGDGLPDLVWSDGQVSLNAGYSFLPREPWGCGKAHLGAYLSGSASASASFSLGKYSIGGGRSFGLSDNWTKQQLIDVNGDGLADRLENAGGSIRAHINMGNGSWVVSATGIPDISTGLSWNESPNFSFTCGGTLAFAKVTGTVSATPWGRSFSCERAQLVDLNGDGLPDHAASAGESDLTVRWNRWGRTGLLKAVSLGVDTLIKVDYSFTPPTAESPQGQWVMASCLTRGNSAGVADSYSTFSYSSPRHDRAGRTPLGFATVVTTQHLHDASGHLVPYRRIVEQYHNDSYQRRGRKSAERVTDVQGHVYDETLYKVALADPASGMATGGPCPAVAIPLVEKTITNHYEGGTTPLLTTAVSFVYDRRRNVVTYTDWGDTNRAGDELRMTMTYNQGLGRNMVALRSGATVRGGLAATAPMLRKSEFLYDSRGGLVSRIDYSSTTGTAQTDMTHDAYGNVIRHTLPPNSSGQRMEIETTYDDTLHMLPIRVSDSYGRVRSTSWCCRHAKPLTVTDAAGATVRYTYDLAGRLASVTAPAELASGAPYTWRARRGDFRAVTEHYDPQHPTDPIRTVTYCDALRRITQVKKDVAVGGMQRMQFSGLTRVDALGRAVAQHDPGICQLADTSARTTALTPKRVATEYDILDRPVRRVTLNGSEQYEETTAFSYVTEGGVTMMRSAVTDPLGRTTSTFTDAHGRRVRVQDPAGGSTATVYDAMGQPLSSTDPEGFTTSYTYDLLGRPTSRSHPDAGMTSTAYDAAGNVTSVTNAAGETVTTAYHYGRPTNVHYPRLPQNDIAYQYDNAGRLSEVTDGSGRTRLYYDVMGNVCRSERTLAVPSLAETYTFATDFAYDSWGRVQQMTYPDGETVSYSYDHGGNLHAMAGVKGGQTRSIVNRILYDSCGNRSLMEYGNGVTTRYTHDSLQRLAHLTTSVPGSSPTALQDIGYTFTTVGGITAIKNTASPLSASPVGGPYTNLFSYDDLDRLTAAAQSFGSGNAMAAYYSPSGRLCRKKQTFTGRDITYGYMNEVRPHAPLRAADEETHSLQRLRWDDGGNLAQVDGFSVSTYGATAEGSRHLFWTEDSRLVDVADGKWLSHYVYDHSGERAVKLTGYNNVIDANAISVDCDAVLKSVTLYPSPYLVATETGYTKHYWAGAERVCSAVGGGGLGANLGGGMPFIGHEPALSAKAGALVEACQQSMAERRLPPEHGGIISSPCGIIHPYFALQLRDVATAVNATIHIYATSFRQTMQHLASPSQGTEPLYYFHSDHLGSASWITDKNGIPVQHLQYLPFGEPFVNQRASGSTYDERFTFTAKERDQETGFSYFGARYYDPDLSALWLSVDPMADKYPGISPYAYCAWNPVKLVDPDGMEAVDDWVKNKKTGLYEWNDNANSPNNTPDGYSYVGNDDALLRDLNVRTDYETKEDCETSYSPDMGSNYAGFTRSRNCNDATIRVGVSVKYDKENISPDNSNGITFDGINIYGFVNQWSKTASRETNTIIYNGILEIRGTNGFHCQSGFSRPSGACLSTAGTIPMQATVHIPVSVVYNNILTNANIKLGHASASLFNSPKSFSWSLLQHSVIH